MIGTLLLATALSAAPATATPATRPADAVFVEGANAALRRAWAGGAEGGAAGAAVAGAAARAAARRKALVIWTPGGRALQGPRRSLAKEVAWSRGPDSTWKRAQRSQDQLSQSCFTATSRQPS